jgi:hypothetical protein
MKNKILLIGVIGFMTITYTTAFSQNSATAKLSAHIQPVSNKKQQPKSSSVAQSTQAGSTTSIRPTAKPLPVHIQPALSKKQQSSKPSSVAQSAHGVSTTSTHSTAKPLPAHVQQPVLTKRQTVKPSVTAGNSTGTNSSVPAIH